MPILTPVVAARCTVNVPTVVDPIGAPGATVQLTAAQTALLTRGRYPYDLQAVLANGNVVTLARGVVFPRPDVAAP